MLARHAIHGALLSLLLAACPNGGGGTDSDPTTGPGTSAASSTDEPAGTTSQPTTGPSGSTTTGTSGGNSVTESTSGDASTGTTTTGAPAGPYGPCSGQEDCEPDLHCVQIYNYCSPNCRIDSDCPLPATGDAMPRCTDSSGGSFCRLACSGPTICPDDMTCIMQQPGPPASCGYP